MAKIIYHFEFKRNFPTCIGAIDEENVVIQRAGSQYWVQYKYI